MEIEIKEVRRVTIQEGPNDYVYLENTLYERLFNKRFADQDNRPWKRGVVKVSNIDRNGKKRSVNRIFASGNSRGIGATMMGIGDQTIAELGINTEGENSIKIKAGSKILFFWNHPDHQARIAFKLAIFFGAFSVISLILSVIGLF